MKNLLVVVGLFLLLVSCGSVFASPVESYSYQEIAIYGDCWTDMRPGGGYDDAGFEIEDDRSGIIGSSGFGIFNMNASVTAGGSDAVPHEAGIGSLAGIGFEMVADDEFVVILSATSAGQLCSDDAQPFSSIGFNGYSWMYSDSEFKLTGFPGQVYGDPIAVEISVEHNGSFGTLHDPDGQDAFNAAEVSLGVLGAPAGQSFSYQKDIFSSATSADELLVEDHSYSAQETINTSVGKTLILSAGLYSEVESTLGQADTFDTISAESNFAYGLTVHLTIVPEPTTVLLILLGTVVLFFRRRIGRTMHSLAG